MSGDTWNDPYYDERTDEVDEGCDYGLCEFCMDPIARQMGCTVNCQLFLEACMEQYREAKEQTKYLVVRDRKTGKPVSIPLSSIPEEIRPEHWFENPTWRYRPDKEDLEPLILGLLSDAPLDNEAVRKLAQYIFNYAAHIAVMGYLFLPGEEGFLFNKECLNRLRPLKESVSTSDDVRKMLHVAMEYAMDPI